eukprot:snap_masked-scaffold_1-processed-gene-21.36-mRNA-1 protein AED:1.00 eAED:1.00 QI:0/0/0/0/1/1/4/0/284
MQNKHRKKTSLDILLSFISYDKHGKFVYQNIISLDCFKKWKNSRRKIPKRPVTAFISLISSHIRGAENYSPFKEEVEEDLLSELRMVNEYGKPADAYHFLRKLQIKNRKRTTAVSVLTYKYPYGYHEKKHKKRRKIRIKKVNIKRNALVVPEKKRREGSNSKLGKTSSIVALADISHNDASTLYKVFNMGKAEIDQCLAALAEVNMSVNFPAIAYLMEKAAKTSYYYSKEWILPFSSHRYPSQRLRFLESQGKSTIWIKTLLISSEIYGMVYWCQLQLRNTLTY